MKIVHKPFRGSEYESGINGKRIAIVGYSFWHDGEYPDNEDWSSFTIGKVISGAWKPKFFSTIRNSFGYTNHNDFWNRVLFFNYVPTMIGTGAQRFATATPEESATANTRFQQILDEYRPDLVFVFTKKTHLGGLGWGFRPLGEPLQAFVEAERAENGYVSKVFRLRHPQGANGKELKQAVAYAFAA